jgi:flagellar P-ring protein precursor FlgI
MSALSVEQTIGRASARRSPAKFGGLKPALRALLLGSLVLLTSTAAAERIKDLASIAGVRPNQLVGYGLVVGLDGTGDQTAQTPFTVQSIKAMLTTQGVTIPPNVNLQLKNVAAVMVSAELPPFAKPGQAIDVTVSSLANAKSLRGGTLLMAPLKGIDGEIYAMAQGSLLVSGFGVSGADGSRVSVNNPLNGTIPNGATVEREVLTPFSLGQTLTLNLHTPDFTTAKRLAETINDTLGPRTADAVDAVSVRVHAPIDPNQRVSFVAFLEGLNVNPGTAAAKVIINSRTGTVVIGSEVRVSAAAVTHGSLTVTISEDYKVNQPEPLTQGQTVVAPDTAIEVTQEKNPMFLFGPGTSLQEIVNAVNRVGAAPGDLVAILEALKRAGALRAELIVI